MTNKIDTEFKVGDVVHTFWVDGHSDAARMIESRIEHVWREGVDLHSGPTEYCVDRFTCREERIFRSRKAAFKDAIKCLSRDVRYGGFGELERIECIENLLLTPREEIWDGPLFRRPDPLWVRFWRWFPLKLAVIASLTGLYGGSFGRGWVNNDGC